MSEEKTRWFVQTTLELIANDPEHPLRTAAIATLARIKRETQTKRERARIAAGAPPPPPTHEADS